MEGEGELHATSAFRPMGPLNLESVWSAMHAAWARERSLRPVTQFLQAARRRLAINRPFGLRLLSSFLPCLGLPPFFGRVRSFPPASFPELAYLNSRSGSPQFFKPPLPSLPPPPPSSQITISTSLAIYTVLCQHQTAASFDLSQQPCTLLPQPSIRHVFRRHLRYLL